MLIKISLSTFCGEMKKFLILLIITVLVTISSSRLAHSQDSFAQEKITKSNSKAEALINKKEHKKALGFLLREYKNKSYNSQSLFLIGLAAREVGDYDTSIKFFNELLEIEPESHRVRFELSISYIKLHKFEEAQKELLAVKSANPPKDIAELIEGFLTGIDRNLKRTQDLAAKKEPKIFYGSLSAGLMHDSNVNYGSLNNQIQIGQLLFNTQPVEKGYAKNYTATLGYNKDLTSNTSFSGFLYGNLIDYNSSKNNNYDLMTAYFSNGINFFTQNSKLYLPFIYNSIWIDSSEFNQSGYLEMSGTSPAFSYKFNQKFYTNTVVGALQKTFRSEALTNRNSAIRSLSNEFNFTLTKSTLLSFTPSLSSEDATLKAYSNKNYGNTFSIVQGFFNNKFKVNFSYSKSRSKYEDNDPIFDVIRSDKIYMIRSGISYDIMPDVRLSLNNNYTKNRSNIQAFSYSKRQTSLSVSYDF
jgi:tetratricopeptide (TPR) repeat protein